MFHVKHAGHGCPVSRPSNYRSIIADPIFIHYRHRLWCARYAPARAGSLWLLFPRCPSRRPVTQETEDADYTSKGNHYESPPNRRVPLLRLQPLPNTSFFTSKIVKRLMVCTRFLHDHHGVT